MQQESGDIGLGVAKMRQKAIQEELCRPTSWRQEKAISRSKGTLAALLVFIFIVVCLVLPLYTSLSLSVTAVLAVVVPVLSYTLIAIASKRKLRRLRDKHVEDLH